MVTFGKGGWSFSDIYNMPTYLRNFYLNEMEEVAKKELERMERQKSR